jgi:hypothetical protein
MDDARRRDDARRFSDARPAIREALWIAVIRVARRPDDVRRITTNSPHVVTCAPP